MPANLAFYVLNATARKLNFSLRRLIQKVQFRMSAKRIKHFNIY